MNSIKLIFLTFIFSSQGFINTSDSQWIQMSNGMGNIIVYSLTTNGNILFTGTYQNGVYFTTNNGVNWVQTSLNNRTVYALAVSGNSIFAGTGNLYGVYKSTDNGTSWSQTPLNNRTIQSLAVNGNNIFAGVVSNDGVYRSTDNGLSWAQTPLNNIPVGALVVNGSTIFAGTDYSGVYKSTDNGTSWAQTTLDSLSIHSLIVNGSEIFAGTGNAGVYKSTNNGLNWIQTSLNYQSILSLSLSGINVFAGSSSSSVFVSNDYGTSWLFRGEGIENARVNALCILNNYLFAGTGVGINGVWRRPLSELVGIKPISEQIPNHYALYQNYPNPFNPVTKIKFSLPHPIHGEMQRVKIVIYDILGREVVILVNEELKPGTYEIEFNAINISSGIYFYQIKTISYFDTKKMILIK